MAAVNDLYEPVKVYNEVKDTFHQNVLDWYDEIVKKTNTDLEDNKRLCEEYEKKLEEVKNNEKIIKKKKTQKGWLTFLGVLCCIVIILIPLAVAVIFKKTKQIKEFIANTNDLITKLNSEAENVKQQAFENAAKVNSSFDWNTVSRLVSKTIPLIQMDDRFEMERFGHLNQVYGINDYTGNDISTLDIQSGSILGNPFIIKKDLVQDIRDEIYTGTLVITWTTTSRDSNGNIHTQHHTQTLVAHVTKPKPYYYTDTYLLYTNEAAPDLHFSREPSNANGMNEKQIKKLTKKTEKKLEKQAKKDTDFTKMANTEFEALFGGQDRDNEVQYRLLFTPLSQKSILELIKTKEPFGDDFQFIKDGMTNFIRTEHSQSFDYSCNPNQFVDYDLARGKEAFVNYCDKFILNFFYDLAPLLCIPLYQNHPSHKYVYKDNYSNRIPLYEVESFANLFPNESFSHKARAEGCELILKADYKGSNGDSDTYNITGHTFMGTPQVDMVPTLGGDGRIHAVPVPWVLYTPVKSSKTIEVKNSKLNRFDFINTNKKLFDNSDENDIYYHKGLISRLIKK